MNVAFPRCGPRYVRQVAGVLLIDDDAAFRESLMPFLEELLPDGSVCAAADGNDGFARVLQMRPNLVLLDQAMPGPSGLQVAQAIAQALPATRVIILSGSDEVDESSVPEGIGFVRKGPAMHGKLTELLAD